MIEACERVWASAWEWATAAGQTPERAAAPAAARQPDLKRRRPSIGNESPVRRGKLNKFTRRRATVRQTFRPRSNHTNAFKTEMQFTASGPSPSSCSGAPPPRLFAWVFHR